MLDPMHLIFSGRYIVYIVKLYDCMPCSKLKISTGLVRHEVELILNNINPANILEVQRQINSARMPYDVGRLPCNAIVKKTIGMPYYAYIYNMPLTFVTTYIQRA